MSLGQFRGILDNSPVVKNLLLINILVFIACLIYGDNLTNILAMHYPTNPEFKPWQLVTHMFTHGGFMHIFFNMYALVTFGGVLENERVLGSKRFAFLYIFSGLGAIFFHLAISAGISYFYTGTVFLSSTMQVSPDAMKAVLQIYYQSLVGASGAIYGLLAAFGYLFPNTPLMFLFLPIPIKAKYLIPLVIIAYDIAFAQVGLDNVAHYAHIGGAIFGFLLVLFWNKTNKKTFY
mgnify:CR=1 FL=1